MPNEIKQVLKYSSFVFAFIVLMMAAYGSFYVNAEYERGVVTRFGEFHNITGPGLHFKLPIVDSVHNADTRLSSFEYERMPTATQDGQTVGITMTINHRILTDDASIRNLYKQFGSNFDYENRILRNMAIDRIKGVVGQYPMEEFMPRREEIRQEASSVVREAAAEYGVTIEDVQISNVYFSDRYKSRLEDVAAARARAAQAEQQEREAKFQANKKIQEARGRAESKEREAEAEAYSVEVQSKANAEAIKREGEAKAQALEAQAKVLENSQGLVELTKAEALKNWDGTSTPQVIMSGGANGMNGMIPFMNMNKMLDK